MVPVAVLMGLLQGCAGPQHRCSEPFSHACQVSTSRWQYAIDTIVLKNFPNELGFYKAVVWEDDFENAWVVKGREIHITKKFLDNLNGLQQLAVAAHELGHLKLGHYYSRIGIILVNTPRHRTGHVGHYPGSVPNLLPKGFGVEQEEEADFIAVRFLGQVGLKPEVYLDLLNWLGKGSTGMTNRINYIRKIIEK